MVPDGCYRPWDLHPLSCVKNGRCAITMIHECYTKRAKGQAIFEEGRKKTKHGYNYSLTEEQIEAELDAIFTELGYALVNTHLRKGGGKMVSTAK